VPKYQQDDPIAAVFKTEKTMPCFMCQAPTQYHDEDFEVHICSPECENDLTSTFLNRYHLVEMNTCKTSRK
jgi:hypothetical protein